MNYDRAITINVGNELTQAKLLAWIAGYDPYFSQSKQQEIYTYVSASDWVNPAFKRHPMFLAESIRTGQRYLFLSPVADKNELATRGASEWELKIALTHLKGLSNNDQATAPTFEPLASELEREIAIDEMMIAYLIESPALEEIGEVVSVERPEIYDQDRAQDDLIFHSTIVITLRIEIDHT